MFFKSILYAALTSVSVFSFSLQAMGGDELAIPGEKSCVRKAIQTNGDRERRLASNLYTLWTEDFGGDFEKLKAFLQSKSFQELLWRKPKVKLAYSHIAIVSSNISHAAGDLLVDRPEAPLYLLLKALFGTNLIEVQGSLREVVDTVNRDCLKPYHELAPERKRRILKRATHIKAGHPHVEDLARNLVSLYQGEFNGNIVRLTDFVSSEEFGAYLSRHPRRREEFNLIAIERSAKFEERDDLNICEEIPEHPLYAYLVKKFGERLGNLKSALRVAISNS